MRFSRHADFDAHVAEADRLAINPEELDAAGEATARQLREMARS